jgi:hypothetical protein
MNIFNGKININNIFRSQIFEKWIFGNINLNLRLDE